MAEGNLFTMLSAYRPGSPANPFENYCTSALAYFLQRGQRMLGALFAQAASATGEPVAIAEVQARIGEGIADLVLTFEGGVRAIVEVQADPGSDERHLPALEASGTQWDLQPAFILLGLRDDVHAPWRPITWLQVAEALEDDPEPLARQFTEFILRDILGLGVVPLDQAITTNRLYALGGSALRRAYGSRVRYQNSESRPLGGKFRYRGTTFALDGGEMANWIGLVNEELPLSEHYHLMLASKAFRVSEPVPQPRATGDWKWPHWTGMGRVVRPVTPEAYEELLGRLLL